MFDISFHGAARTVTGSCHLIDFNGTRILLDCGLFQGRRSESYERNNGFGFDPASIDVLILSHAHIDHTGKVPMLYKHGFRGQIISTHATRDLANIMLLDSAYLQEKDAEYVNKLHKKKGLPPVDALYDVDDVIRSLSHFQTIGYQRSTRVAENVDVTFYDAGHILGSALTVLEFRRDGSRIRLCYTGDLGRPDRPILRDPRFTGDVDVLVTESTYGGRHHLDNVGIMDRLEDVIKRTAARGGRIIVPAFAVGRTQELAYNLNLLFQHDRLPEIPIYVDSPLGLNATQIFRVHPECMDEEARSLVLTHRDPFGFENLTYIQHVSQSKKLNEQDGPMMIISASGMCEGGRVLHHLRNNIEDKKNTILITGYNAQYTLGRRIVEREKEVKIFGEPHALNAEVKVINSLSAHADQDELLAYHGQYNSDVLEKVFIVHGDYDQQQKLKTVLGDKLGLTDIEIPHEDAKFTI